MAVLLLVEIRGDGIAPRDVLIDLGQYCQSRGSAVRFADGDGTHPLADTTGDCRTFTGPAYLSG